MTRRSLTDRSVPELLLGAFAVAVLVSLAVAASTSTAAFGLYNDRWDGSAQLRGLATDEGASVVVASNASAYDRVDPASSVAVVLSPAAPYGPRATGQVRAFVRAGGTLVVAEDYRPHANPLLAGVNASIRVDGTPVRDTRQYYRTPAFPETRTTNATMLGDDVETVVFNHGTAVDPGTGTVLLETSSYAYRDVDGTGTLDQQETMRALPVAATERVGDGRVVVVGDPSVFVNAMLERADNRAFARQVVGGDTVLLDHSHAGAVPPLVQAVLTLRRVPALQFVAGVAVVALIVGLARLDPDRRQRLRDRLRGREESDPTTGALSTDAVRTYVEREHPEWDAGRVERVTEAVMGLRESPPDDD